MAGRRADTKSESSDADATSPPLVGRDPALALGHRPGCISAVEVFAGRQPARWEGRDAGMLEIDNVQDHTSLGLGDDQVIEMYRTMLRARRLDDRMWALNRQGRVPFVVSVSGHEATQVGVAAALDPQKDWSLPYYRDIAFNIALGITAGGDHPRRLLQGSRPGLGRSPDAKPRSEPI